MSRRPIVFVVKKILQSGSVRTPILVGVEVLTGEVEAILRLGGCVGVVENHQNGADAGGGKKDRSVLLAVPGHDANTVSDADAHVEHGLGQQAAVVVELIVCPSRARPGDHEGFLGAVMQTLEVEQLAESQVDKRRVGWAVEDGQAPGLWQDSTVVDVL